MGGANLGAPIWSCDESLVGLFGDGTKWVCALQGTRKKNCGVPKGALHTHSA